MAKRDYVYCDFKNSVYRTLQDISGYDEATRNGIKDAVKKGTRAVWEAARARVPVRTGHLRSGIMHRTHLTGNTAEGKVWSSSANGRQYGTYLEYGTDDRLTVAKKRALKINGRFVYWFVHNGRVVRRAYMRGAIAQERPKIEEAVARAIREGGKR